MTFSKIRAFQKHLEAIGYVTNEVPDNWRAVFEVTNRHGEILGEVYINRKWKLVGPEEIIEIYERDCWDA